MIDFDAVNDTISFGMFTLSLGQAFLALLALAFVGLLLGWVRGAGRRKAEERATAAEMRLAEISRTQTEMQGRLQAMTQLFGARQTELNTAIGERLDGLAHRLGHSLSEQTRSTHENLRSLQERLAVIDSAQNNIQSLAKDVVGLQAILANKQTRGAFGQARMETIIADALPLGAYQFQATLSNGSRPDCVIRLPNGQASLVIDAKFPLEAWNTIRAAREPEDAKAAAQRFRRDLEVHVKDISRKYRIAGETQDTALMFVPSESIFADIHEQFGSVIQAAHRARVMIVSPSLLLLSIQVIQSMLRDQHMREQAHVIQAEVIRLMEDLVRLDDRVGKLKSHFASAQKDVEQIETTSSKISQRGRRIEEMDFDRGASEADAAVPRSVESRTGQLKLRVVDED